MNSGIDNLYVVHVVQFIMIRCSHTFYYVKLCVRFIAMVVWLCDLYALRNECVQIERGRKEGFQCL